MYQLPAFCGIKKNHCPVNEKSQTDFILSQTYTVISSNFFLSIRFDIIHSLRHVFQVLTSF
jgi:hypothetical protein